MTDLSGVEDLFNEAYDRLRGVHDAMEAIVAEAEENEDTHPFGPILPGLFVGLATILSDAMDTLDGLWTELRKAVDKKADA